MPFLLGLSSIFRFLIGLIPLCIGYLASFLGKLSIKSGLVATALVAASFSVVSMAVTWLASIVHTSLPADFSNLMASVMPDFTNQAVTIIMSTRIAVFAFDLKDRFLSIANRFI